MKEKSNEILTAIAKLPASGYGKYHFNEELVKIIDRVMGYEEYKFQHGRFQSKEIAKVAEIIRRMEERKLIIKSKSGTMFKLNYTAVAEFDRA